jgi:hypothetical protein
MSQGDREQAGLEERFNTTPKKSRLEGQLEADSKGRRPDSEINPKLLDLAKHARERRNHIREKIRALGQLPDDAAQCPNAVVELSEAALELSKPSTHIKLPFPFVGATVLTRFKIDPKDGYNWSYAGRERFEDLVTNFQNVQLYPNRTALWVYGTRGYGKSHLLAALVCYLAAQEKHVVYIPDCREFVKRPVAYFRAAMLFAWADNEAIQQEIIKLNSLEEIQTFLDLHGNIIFVFDQINGFPEGRGKWMEELRRWLDSYRAEHKAILSASANHKAYLISEQHQSTEVSMRVYGGLTAVSLGKNNCFTNGILLTVI